MFRITKRGRLPHWYTTHATYFATFNLFDAMPQEVQDRLALERSIRIAELERLKEKATAAELHAIDELIRERAEEALDSGYGACFMNDERIADLVAGAIKYFDHERYEVHAWCVMPNHVHVVFDPHESVDRILHSWKSYTSKEASRILNRDGDFWQEGYFDHLIRNPRELERTITYVLENPIKAGLRNWRWVGARASRPQSSGVSPDD